MRNRGCRKRIVGASLLLVAPDVAEDCKGENGEMKTRSDDRVRQWARDAAIIERRACQHLCISKRGSSSSSHLSELTAVVIGQECSKGLTL